MSVEHLNSESIVRLRPSLARPEAGTSPLDVSDEWEASTPQGEPAAVRTIFLRGSECRFHCVMCDLWRYTHEGPMSSGAIAQQVREGVARPLDAAFSTRHRWLKLYNASSFFDTRNVPAGDLPDIAASVEQFERVIVENHPLLLPWLAIDDFRGRLGGRLEIALGLETVDPAVLSRLNKRITTDDFAHAAQTLRERDVDIRAFVLLRPPWTEEAAALEWCRRSVEFAIAQGARHVTIIPVRGGNGALEWLGAQGQFEPPKAESLENIVGDFLSQDGCVVTADLWDWHKLRGTCDQCSQPRRLRLERMNLTRVDEPVHRCEVCNV